MVASTPPLTRARSTGYIAASEIISAALYRIDPHSGIASMIGPTRFQPYRGHSCQRRDLRVRLRRQHRLARLNLGCYDRHRLVRPCGGPSNRCCSNSRARISCSHLAWTYRDLRCSSELIDATLVLEGLKHACGENTCAGASKECTDKESILIRFRQILCLWCCSQLCRNGSRGVS